MRLHLFTIAVAALAASCAAPPRQNPDVASTGAPPKAAAAAPVGAVAPSPALTAGAEALVAAFNSRTPASTLFVTNLTEEQRAGLRRADAMLIRMRERRGPIVGIDRIEAETPYKGRVHLNLETGQASFRIGVEPEPPHRIIGMEIGR